MLINWVPEENNKQEISIFSATDGSLIHNETISVDGYITGSAVDARDFWVSYSHYSNQSVIYETRLFSFDGEELEVEVIEGLPLIDVTSVPGKFAMAVDNYGIIFGDERLIPIRGSSKPVSLSLNESGSRLMVSMNDGTVRIYNTETLEETARMLHPDQRSQFIISSNGYYTSNTGVREWIAVKQGENSLPVEFAERFNRPDKVLESFDITNPQYLNLLERSVQIRMQRAAASLPELSAVSVPVISDILIDGDRTNRTTENDTISISFHVYDELFDIEQINLSLNGVLINRMDGSGTTGDTIRVNESIPLIPGQNIIHINAVNSSGGSSIRYERIVEKSMDEKPDLYLLSIGVSQYENPEFNLTFADKDALDMAILFGDTTTVDLQQYMNTYYGKEYTLQGENLPDDMQPIRYYAGGYSSIGTFFQTDAAGYFWLERTYRERGDFLWDFKNGIRRPINLPNINDNQWDFDQNSVITDPDNRHIIYVDTTNALIYYDTETDQYQSYSLDPFTFKTIIPYDENRLIGQLSYDLRGGDFGVNPIMLMDLSGELVVYDELPYELTSGQELLALSPDRKSILVSEYNELSMLYEDDPDILRRISNLSAGYNQIFTFHPDLPVITTLDSDYNTDTRNTEWTQYSYNIQERKADSVRVNDHTNELLGVNIKSGEVRWIEAENPIAALSVFDEDNISSLAGLSPESFEKVYIKTIVNNEATKSNIIRELNSFFEQAGEDDQVVVFLAGHGLLGDDYTYYFAPHDMQFAETSAYGVSYDEILSALSNTRSTRRLLLMDTCHAGEVYQIEQVQRGDSRYDSDVSRSLIVNQQAMFLDSPADVITQLFNQTGSSSGITVLSASGGAEVAYESTECAVLTNGAFTAALIGYIKNEFSMFGTYINEDRVRPLVLENNFMDFISNEVLRTTCNRQVPNSREINPLSTVWLW
jgi:WD40 repeat protein